jgi:hypothetical protein
LDHLILMTEKTYEDLEMELTEMWCYSILKLSLALCNIWGSHNGGYEEFYLMGYNAV